MNEKLSKRLFKDYKKLFEPPKIRNDPMKSCMSWGFECGDGWAELLEDMFKEIQNYVVANKVKGFHFVQIKEKFGGLRAYTSFEDDTIRSIIRKAEDRAEHTCEVCGKEGKIRRGGWLRCLCAECAKPTISDVITDVV